MKKVRAIEKVATALSTGLWVPNDVLARIQHRFSASLLLLRKGEFDGKCWDIEKESCGAGHWRYRFRGHLKSDYVPQSPRCLDCGSLRVMVRDDRVGAR